MELSKKIYKYARMEKVFLIVQDEKDKKMIDLHLVCN